MRFIPPFALLFSLAFVGGCLSEPSSGAATTPPSEAPADGPPSAASPPAGAPSPPSMPRVVSRGGPIIATPRIVPVFFGEDAMQPKMEAFLHTLEGSAYWKAVTAEYGVGALTVAPSIVTTDAPPATDDDLQAWLGAQPGASASTVFAVYYPPSTPYEIHGKKACRAFDGYHHDGTTKSGVPFAFALLARCKTDAGELDALTKATSHELVEAVTDPFYYTRPAYSAADADHAAWTLTTVGEVTDMCELEKQEGVRVGEFLVARSWSNAEAAAGHDPCLPTTGEPYFLAAPVLDDDVTIDDGRGATTKGVRVPVGESRTVDVVLSSDGPFDGWRIEGRDASAMFGGPKELELSLDRKTGKAGDVLHLTIKALRPGRFGGSIFALVSSSNANAHVALGFVAN